MTVIELMVYLDRLYKEGLGNTEVVYQSYTGEVLDINDVTPGSYNIKLTE